MIGEGGVDSTHVAFAMAVRRLELRYGLFIHASSEWIFISHHRPPSNSSVFAALHAPAVGIALEREVDSEPRLRKLGPS